MHCKADVLLDNSNHDIQDEPFHMTLAPLNHTVEPIKDNSKPCRQRMAYLSEEFTMTLIHAPGHRTTMPLLLILFFSLAGSSACSYKQTPSGQAVFELLSEQEYQQLLQHSEGDQKDLERVVQPNPDGPAIIIESPNQDTQQSPIDLLVRFQPEGTASLDMTSLKVSYRKGFFWLDVTRRLLQHAVFGERSIEVRGAAVPRGEHIFRISILDTEGRQGLREVAFTVL